MWNKYNSLPRDHFDRCGSPLGVNQENIYPATSNTGVLMTPLHEIDEVSQEFKQSGHWTAFRFTPDAVRQVDSIIM